MVAVALIADSKAKWLARHAASYSFIMCSECTTAGGGVFVMAVYGAFTCN